MATRGKAKGNNGELKIAKFLTELFGAKFMRVPNSGAYLGGKNTDRKTLMDSVQISYFKSDIIPPTNMRRLVIESKFYKDFPFHKLVVHEPIAQLDKWIKQTLETTDPEDVWFVVVRINHKGSFACFDRRHLPDFVVDNYAVYYNYAWVDFEPFFTANKAKILELSSTPTG
jgi:hypothetical protein